MQQRDLIRRIQSDTGAFSGLLACTIEGSPDQHFVCQLCGSTTLEVPREVCPICKKAASQYRGVERGKRITTEQAGRLPADSLPAIKGYHSLRLKFLAKMRRHNIIENNVRQVMTERSFAWV